MTDRERELTEALSNLLRAIDSLEPEAFFYLRPIRNEVQQAKQVLGIQVTSFLFCTPNSK